MRHAPSLVLALAALGCGSGDGMPGTTDGGTDANAGPVAIADHEFGAFQAWATPIEDYRAVGEKLFSGAYAQGIHDLAPLSDRLYLGYGDGNVNMGEHIAIDFRAFTSPDDPGPVSEEASFEEQLDRYRLLDEVLWQAGVDSNDADELRVRPLIAGNVYHRAADGWRKHRTVLGGEHVHDIARFEGDLFAVGSGADNRTEFESGQIFRYVWQSHDDGDTFTTVRRVMFTGGDTRWVHLLVTTGALFVFGYESNAGVATIRNARYASGEVTDLDAGPLSTLFATATDPLPDGSGLLRGIDAATVDRPNQIWRVHSEGDVAVLGELAGRSVVDVSVREETGEILYLALDGDDSAALGPPYGVAVLFATVAEPGSIEEIARFDTEVTPRSIAFWQGSLFLGTDDAQVLRAVGQP